jgi:hypothetical protein
VKKKADKKISQWIVGKFYFVRTVTLYYVGRLVCVGEHEITLDQCAWVADTGRFSECLNTGKLAEVEPFPDGPVNIGRGSIIDASLWSGPAQRIVLWFLRPS